MFQIKHFVTSHGIVSYYYFFYQDISHDFNEFHANLAKSQPRIPRTSQASEQNGSTACHCVWPSQLTAQNSSDETLPPKKSENKHQKYQKVTNQVLQTSTLPSLTPMKSSLEVCFFKT